MSRFSSEALGERDRSAFASGNERIDHYFRTVVGQDIRRGYASCYVLVDRTNDAVAGFHTLAAHSIRLEDFPDAVARKLPRYPHVPVALIGWMGRDWRFRGLDLGRMLLSDALQRIRTSGMAAFAAVVDPIDDAAEQFYLDRHFSRLPNSRMFLPMATAAKLFGP